MKKAIFEAKEAADLRTMAEFVRPAFRDARLTQHMKRGLRGMSLRIRPDETEIQFETDPTVMLPLGRSRRRRVLGERPFNLERFGLIPEPRD